VGGGVTVQARVVPRSRPRCELIEDQLVIWVAAPPVGGAATQEARRALAKALGVAPSKVKLIRGARSRSKVFSIEGISEVAARRALGLAPADRPGANPSG
jgi:hypothetical protein